MEKSFIHKNTSSLYNFTGGLVQNVECWVLMNDFKDCKVVKWLRTYIYRRGEGIYKMGSRILGSGYHLQLSLIVVYNLGFTPLHLYPYIYVL